MADILGFMAGREIARREGVDDDRAKTLGLITGIMGATPTALVAVSLVARREGVALAAATVPPIEVPNVIGHFFCKAEADLTKKGLNVLRTNCACSAEQNTVIGQSPESPKGDFKVPQGSQVVLCVSTGEAHSSPPAVASTPKNLK